MLLAAWGVAIAGHLLLAHAYRGPLGGDTRFHRLVAMTLALAALAQMSLLTTTTSSNSRIDSLDSVAL